MQCKEITQIIEERYPRNAALSFDNVGLLVGRMEKEVQKVFLALDATEEVIDAAIASGADMLITHHPMIFSPIKRVTDEDFLGRRIVKLLQNDISYYAMHTNYDVLGMADLAAEMIELQQADVLDVTMEQDEKEEGIGRVGALPWEMTLAECAHYIKTKLVLEHVSVFGDLDQKVSRAAISPGSGKSMIDVSLEKGAQVLITGDIGHHEGLDALAQGLAIIDAGHYGTEYIYIEAMKSFIQNHIPALEIQTAEKRFPISVI